MSLVLGLDSGGTKTVLALADRSGEVTVLRHGPGLDPSTGRDWAEDLKALLATDGQGLEGAVLGLPFHDEVERYSREQTAVASTLIPGRTLVQNDVRIAFDGALAGRAGALALAGTGSMAWASLNGPDDAHIRVGGWGDAFGDEGSAFWIGREALAIVSRHLDGRISAPDFCDAILGAIGVGPEALLGWCYAVENRRVEFARLAVTVSALADRGEPSARALLQAAADQLAAQVMAAWKQTRTAAPLLWSYAGGVLSSEPMRRLMAEKLGSDPVPPRLPPVGGALLRAAALAGWATDEAWTDRLSESLRLSSANDDLQQ